MIKLIVALGPNNLLGSGNKMAWHIPAEFKHFKETTMGHSLFMGGNTFKGLPGKLPGRKHYIFDKETVEGADVMIRAIFQAHDLFREFKNSKEVLWIAGGKFVYETFYKYADELIVSEVKTSAKGDVYLNWNLEDYKKELIKEETDFYVYKYTKK